MLMFMHDTSFHKDSLQSGNLLVMVIWCWVMASRRKKELFKTTNYIIFLFWNTIPLENFYGRKIYYWSFDDR